MRLEKILFLCESQVKILKALKIYKENTNNRTPNGIVVFLNNELYCILDEEWILCALVLLNTHPFVTNYTLLYVLY